MSLREPYCERCRDIGLAQMIEWSDDSVGGDTDAKWWVAQARKRKEEGFAPASMLDPEGDNDE